MTISKGLKCFSTHLEKESDYYLGNNITNEFTEVLNKYEYDCIYMVTTEKLYELYGKEYKEIFNNNNINNKIIFIKDSEEDKNFLTLQKLCVTLVEKNISKSSIIIAFGGGCLGNIVGLASSLIFRGIRYIEIPTTFMAVTDSTLSNKQAINGGHGKNQFGVYYAPIFIWADVKYLMTENIKNLNGAIVEGVKNSLISNSELLEYYKNNLKIMGQEYTENEMQELVEIIIKSKLEILKKDPTEKDYAMILEYGHTFGHAIEWLTKGEVIHGLAVAIGMCIAGELAVELGIMTEDALYEQYIIFREILGIDVSIPNNITADEIMKVISSDNKKSAKGVKYVLLEKIGVPHNPDGDYEVYVHPDKVKSVLFNYINKVKKERYQYV